MTFSEFGRRVKENGSRGTDHGAASCMFVAGPAVKGGLVGKHPSLADLTDGDLKYHTDFRRVYATLLDDWLGVDSKAVLGREVRAAQAPEEGVTVARGGRAKPTDLIVRGLCPLPIAFPKNLNSPDVFRPGRRPSG